MASPPWMVVAFWPFGLELVDGDGIGEDADEEDSEVAAVDAGEGDEFSKVNWVDVAEREGAGVVDEGMLGVEAFAMFGAVPSDELGVVGVVPAVMPLLLAEDNVKPLLGEGVVSADEFDGESLGTGEECAGTAVTTMNA